MVIVAIGCIWWSKYQDVHRIDSLAVLPFANLSGDEAQEYFADGITEALITELQQLATNKLRIIGRTSVMSFKQTDKTLPEIAAELGVDAIVEASVIRSGDLVKVAAKLIRARPQEQQIWADTFEHNLRDILTLQAELAREVASQIQLVLSPEAEASLFEERTVNPEAYEAYLKGRHYLLNLPLSGVRSRDPQSIKDFHLIGSSFTKSIQIDSTYAPAWAGLAEYHIQREHERIGSDATPQAFAAVTRALELDDSLGAAHATLAHILWEHQYKPREAEAELRRAFELNPNDPWAHLINAYFCMTMGRFEESVRATLRANELDPLSRFINMASWQPLSLAGWHDEAIRQVEKTHEIFPDSKSWRALLALVYRLAGRYEEGLAVIEEADPDDVTLSEHLQVPPLLIAMDRPIEARAYLERFKSQAESDSLFWGLSNAYASVGDLDEARKWLDEAEKASSADLFSLAELSVMIGDLDRAFAYFEQAYENRNWNLTRLATFVEKWPEWKPLADDPRYHDLVRRMGLRD